MTYLNPEHMPLSAKQGLGVAIASGPGVILLLNEFGLYPGLPSPLRTVCVCLLVAAVILMAWPKKGEGGAG